MKKFLCSIPRAESVRASSYYAAGNERLHYGTPGQMPRACASPILPVIAGYANAGDEIAVIVLTDGSAGAEHNYGILTSELRELCLERHIRLNGAAEERTAEVRSVQQHGGSLLAVREEARQAGSPVRIINQRTDGAAVNCFQELIGMIEDGDELYVCLPEDQTAALLMLMTIRYARSARKDVYIGCVAAADIDPETGRAELLDETALIRLDDIVRVLAQNGTMDPKDAIKRILDA